MWPKIGWKKEGLWTRYPGSFCWSLDAPDGHMPFNKSTKRSKTYGLHPKASCYCRET